MSKPRNPGYKPGDHWVIDDIYGMARRKSELRQRWDKMWMPANDWESRHPQDFVRARKDRISPDQPIRPDNTGSEIINGPTYLADPHGTIPSGTFDNDLES